MSRRRSLARAKVAPVDCLATLFTARRDLLEPIRKAVMKGTGLTVDQADVLVLLYGNQELGWDDFTCGPDGFAAVRDLRRALVHDPGLFSRRLRDLRNAGLLEAPARPARAPGQRAYLQAVRITRQGVATIRPVWERYCRLAERLLTGVPQAELEAHCRVNQKISAEIDARRRGFWEGLTE